MKRSSLSKNLGNKIRKIRRFLEMHQREVGDYLHVTRACICHYERGIRFPSEEVLERFINLCNSRGVSISADDLIDDETFIGLS